jgi:hypothetical protein
MARHEAISAHALAVTFTRAAAAVWRGDKPSPEQGAQAAKTPESLPTERAERMAMPSPSARRGSAATPGAGPFASARPGRKKPRRLCDQQPGEGDCKAGIAVVDRELSSLLTLLLSVPTACK